MKSPILSVLDVVIQLLPVQQSTEPEDKLAQKYLSIKEKLIMASSEGLTSQN